MATLGTTGTAGTAGGVSGTPQDPFDLLISDHMEFRSFLKQWETMSGSKDFATMSGFLRTIVGKLSQHTSLEEQLIHDLYEKYLGAEGRRFYERSLEMDNSDKKILDSLDRSEPAKDLSSIITNMTDLAKSLAIHMTFEENEVWPLLRTKMSLTERHDLYNKLIRLRESGTLPTHPHPWGPSGVIGAKVAHPMAGMLDRAKDAVTGRHVDNL